MLKGTRFPCLDLLLWPDDLTTVRQKFGVSWSSVIPWQGGLHENCQARCSLEPPLGEPTNRRRVQISRSYQLLRSCGAKNSPIRWCVISSTSASNVLRGLKTVAQLLPCEGPHTEVCGRTTYSAPDVLGRLNLIKPFVCAGRLNPRILIKELPIRFLFNHHVLSISYSLVDVNNYFTH